MTSESSRSRSTDFHGCMRGVLHFFDFNSALSCRKILPAQRSCDDSDTPRDNVDLRSRAVMKDDNEEKKKIPNVVARLMGLDKMPEDLCLADQSIGNPTNASIFLDKKQQDRPITLLKSRSVHTMNEISAPSPQNADGETGKLQFRSRSFRGHPQEKQLEEFKREFEASQRMQYRGSPQHVQQVNMKLKQNNFQEQANDAHKFSSRDRCVDSKKSSGRESRYQPREFLDALEYIQKNDDVFLNVLRDPNSLLGNHIHRACPEDPNRVSVEEYIPRFNAKELASPRSAGLKMQGEVILSPHSRSSSPSKNFSNPLPATIVVLKSNGGNTNLKVKNFKDEAKQSGKDTSKDLRNNKGIAKMNKIKEYGIKKVDSHKASPSISSSRRRVLPQLTISSGEVSLNGEEAPLTPKKLSSSSGKYSPSLQNSPRLGKSMEEINKEDRKVSIQKRPQCQRGFEEKKVCSRPHSARSAKRDVHVHDRIASTVFAPNSDCATAKSVKKSTSPQNLVSKGKNPRMKCALSLSKSMGTKINLITKTENTQATVANSHVADANDNIQAIFQECSGDNTLDGACKQPCGVVADGTNEKCEHLSPISVLDGPFQQESPSPINLKESATDFHELRTKLCFLTLNRADSKDSKEDRQTHHIEEEMLSRSRLFEEEMSLAAREKKSSCKSLQVFEMQSSSFESLRVDGIAFPEGKEADLLYVRNVLVSAGFNTDNILAFTRWYSPCHPIDPHVFDRLENYYNDLKADNPCINSSSKSQACERSKLLPDMLNRKLIFELIDEILCKKIKPCLNTQAWINPTKPSLRYMSTGKQLLREVWDEICSYPEAYCEILEDVEALIGRDVTHEAPWVGDNEDIEKIGFEVAQLVFNHLLEEAVHELLSLKK